MFVDEISMTGCEMIQRVSTTLSDARETSVSFGGIDMIFAGDFYQLPPTTNDPAYRAPSISRNVNLTKATMGYLKFVGGLTHTIFLRVQHRMNDEKYKAVVSRFRTGSQIYSDELYIKSKMITNENTLSTGHLKDLENDPLIIVKNNDIRYDINMAKAIQHADASGEKLLVNIAKDSSKLPIDNNTRLQILRQHESGKTGYGAGTQLLHSTPHTPTPILIHYCCHLVLLTHSYVHQF